MIEPHTHIETWLVREDGCTCISCMKCGEIVKHISYCTVHGWPEGDSA